MGRRQTAKTPRGFVRLHRLNKEPGNLGFTIPASLMETVHDPDERVVVRGTGWSAGDLFRPVVLVDGIAFIKVPDHSPPEERPE